MSNALNDLIEIAAAQGRTKWLQKLLRQRLPELNGSNANYHDWFDSFIQVMEERGLVKPTQQKDYLSDVRNAIKVLEPNHPALLVVDFDKSTWTEINNRNSARIAERTTKFISNPDAIVQRATVLLGSYQWSEIAAGLAVVTGRRCTEVIQTAQFEYQSLYSVIFTGSLKRKNEPVECVFEIPTLCESPLVLDAIASLRHQLGESIQRLSPRQVSSRYAQAVATKCERYFRELVPTRDERDNLYTHLFRAIYATIAAYWYCPPTVPEMEFRAAIQGHYQILDEKNPELRRSLAAGRNYFDYKISDGEGNIDGRLGIKLGLPDVEVIGQFQHAYTPRQSSRLSPPPSTISEVITQEPTTARDKTKTNQSKSPSAMTEQSNSSHHSAVAIPSFFLSRLDAIAHRLGLSPAETIQALFTWTEMGLSLADSLEIDELHPQAVFESVEGLKQQASLSPFSATSVPPTPTPQIVDQDVSLNKEQALFKLCHSVSLLSQAISELNSPDSLSTQAPSNDQRLSIRQPRPPERPSQGDTKNSQIATEQPSSSFNSQDQRVRSDGRTRSQRSIESERAINHAIERVMEFNNAPDRNHRDKWYIGIGSIRTLTGRGDKVIKRVLQQREDVEPHHHLHHLDQSHNLKGRDATPISDVISL